MIAPKRKQNCCDHRIRDAVFHQGQQQLHGIWTSHARQSMVGNKLEPNELVSEGTIKRLLAQVDIAQSNSMIEAWWRQLKHQWLFLNELDSATSVRKLVGFYVEQHNTVVPHFAFEGQTPDEMYFGTGASVPATLKQKRDQARAARLAHNRAVTCARCKIEDTKPAMVRFYFQLSIIHFLAAQRLAPMVRFYFQLTTIHFLAAQRPAEFSNAFFQNVLQRRSANNVDRTHVSRILQLTSLSPTIVEQILEGKEPEGMSLRQLRKGIPLLWSEQGKIAEA